MEIGLTTGFFTNKNKSELTKEEVDLIEKAGFRYVELDPWMAMGGFRQEYVEKLAEDLERRGMIVHGFHEILYKYGSIKYSEARLNSINEDQRKYVLDNDKEQVDRLQIFCPKIMVVHPGIPSEDRGLAERQKEKCRASLEELADYCNKKSITLAVENDHHPYFLEHLMELLAPFGPKDIGICFDTGHAHMAGENVVEKVEICKDRLIALHCCDNHGIGSPDEHTLPYHGTIKNWGGFYGALQHIDYTGVFMYEPKYQPNPERVLAEMSESFCRMQRESEKLI